MTQATWSIASGEHQPWTACAAWSAGIAAERRSGYFAIAASISRRSSSGTGVIAGSGIVAGSFVRSTASSQPGTRLPWAKRGTGTGGIVRRSGGCRGGWRSCRSAWLSVDPADDRVEHRERGDQVGDVGPVDHRLERLHVVEARVAHVHARGLGGAVGAHEAAELPTRGLDRVVRLSRRHPEALGDELEVVDERLHARRELVARRQRDLAVGRDERALGQPLERLADDLRRLVQLGLADAVAVVVVADGADRDLEVEVVVAGVGRGLAQVPRVAGRAQERHGDAEFQQRLLVDDARLMQAL